MIRLYVNVDHVATLREARKTDYPDPLQAALLSEKAGAFGITIHLREDRRHIQDHDVSRIKSKITTPLNLEMAAVEEMIEIALKTRPAQVSLVPEKRQEITTEGGLDVVSQRESLKGVGDRIKEAGILFSLFVDPDVRQIDAAKGAGAQSIEINTGAYAEASGAGQERELEKIMIASRHAAKQGLRVFAGHGLTYENVVAIASIPEIEELNIGHFLVGQSVYSGMEEAVKRMIEAMNAGISQRPVENL